MPTKNLSLWDPSTPLIQGPQGPVGPAGPQGPAGAERAADLWWSGVTLQNPSYFSGAMVFVRTVSALNAIQIVGYTWMAIQLPPGASIDFVQLPVGYRTNYLNVQMAPCRCALTDYSTGVGWVMISGAGRISLIMPWPLTALDFRISTITFTFYDMAT